MIEKFIQFFYVYLGNWSVLASVGCLYFLVLRTFTRPLFNRLWNSVKFDRIWIFIGMSIVLTISLREIMLYPFNSIIGWLPNSYLWEQILVWLQTTHLPSIIFYTILIFYLWNKYDDAVSSVVIGLFTIGIIELTFIPQHFLAWNFFMGWNWYSAFIICCVPLIVERKRFIITNKKMFNLLFLGAIIIQYLILLPLMPYSLSNFDSTIKAFTVVSKFLPHPSFITWFFMELNHVLKILYILAFSFVGVKNGYA